MISAREKGRHFWRALYVQNLNSVVHVKFIKLNTEVLCFCMYVSYSSIKNVIYIREKAKSKYEYFYISKQKTLRKKICQQNHTKKNTKKSYLDRKMILNHKIKIQERIKRNWYRYIKYINLNEYCLCKQ